ncbi:MAG: hypothetical protein ACREJM_12995, partial [Candidatus Saccharimonadales bacterium]
MALLLTRSEVADLLSMGQAIECTKAAFLEQANGHVCPQAPFVVGHDDRELRVNAGALAESQRAGLRAGMRGSGLALLYDTASQELLSAMAYPFTYLRVGATVALAVHHLAPPDAQRLLVIGTGRIARMAVEGISCLRQFERLHVFSRQAENRASFCAFAADRLGLDIQPVETAEPAAREADVVVVATSAEEPVLDAAWLG